MKIFFFLLISLNLYALDMSRTESWKTAYKDLPDGSVKYIGKCTTHQDYNEKYFKQTKTLVNYFEPNYKNRSEDIKKHLKNIDPLLIKATVNHLSLESISDVDDITIEKIESFIFRNAELFRLNVGVGGGNGVYIVFNKTVKNSKISYELISSIMDGDVNFCESKVWLLK